LSKTLPKSRRSAALIRIESYTQTSDEFLITGSSSQCIIVKRPADSLIKS